MKNISIVSSAVAFDDLCRNIKSVIDTNLLTTFKLSTIKEAISAGYGFNTHAALIGKFKKDIDFSIQLDAFDYLSFIERLFHIHNDIYSVVAIGAIIDGCRLEIKIKKLPYNNKYDNTEYTFTAAVNKHSGERISFPFDFIMPVFGSGSAEKYRIDSNYMYRRVSVGRYALTRDNLGRNLLNVRADGGEWGGGIFIYSRQYQINDSECLRIISSAVAKRILPAISPRFSIELYRPDSYVHGKWRLNIKLGDVAQACFADGIATLGKAFIEKNRFNYVELKNIDIMKPDKFNDGVFSADVNTHVIEEDMNSKPIDEAYKELYKETLAQLTQTGLTIKPYWVCEI
ncbi:hypothetical protein [Aeromonas veronii]|uniref:hypothetical protein n=1 Tax=Aeromonas veronii TaxID=654 RepID=UPI00224642FA|nr:hypothetical protein [Aeromonas veronii]MCX0443426.1 hypothetical protein [Aeromonas veronii]